MTTEIETKIKVFPIQEIGSGRDGYLNSTFKEIVEKIFEPNVTEFDDYPKVDASWGFQDESGRKAFIWCYYAWRGTCTQWSICGDVSLLTEIFGDKISLNSY
jgi:hypothetical protein